MAKTKIVFKSSETKKVIGEAQVNGELSSRDIYDEVYEIIRERKFLLHHFGVTAEIYDGSKDPSGKEVPTTMMFPGVIGLYGGSSAKPGSEESPVVKRYAVIRSGKRELEIKLPTELREDSSLSEEELLDRAMDYIMEHIDSHAKNFPKDEALTIRVSSSKGLSTVRRYDPKDLSETQEEQPGSFE